MLLDLFAGPSHISGVGLAGQTPDEAIWEYAKENGFAIVTAGRAVDSPLRDRDH
jgi:predicted nuclease of predicted toxin-antitoxin system